MGDAIREVVRSDRRPDVPELDRPVETIAVPQTDGLLDWFPCVDVEPVVDRDPLIDELIANPGTYGSIQAPDGTFGTGTIHYSEAIDDRRATLGLTLSLYLGEEIACLHFQSPWKRLNRALDESEGLRRWFYSIARAAGGELVLRDHDAADQVEVLYPDGTRKALVDSHELDYTDALAAAATRAIRHAS
ncbi:hypothetical protein [Rubrivirga sp. IMCC43871]|uniref:hypothetical protein n=1 Tax=Rubrivirga sp. IMCC43871 TaxID=3391575 RepID=UPI003990033A